MKRKLKSGNTRLKSKLGLPDLEHAKVAVIVSLRSFESQRSYRHSIDEFVAWYCSARSAAVVQQGGHPSLPTLSRRSSPGRRNHKRQAGSRTTGGI